MAIPRDETETTMREIEDTTDGKEAHRMGSETVIDGYQTGTAIESAEAVEAAVRQTGLRGTIKIDLVRMAEDMSDKTTGVEVLSITVSIHA